MALSHTQWQCHEEDSALFICRLRLFLVTVSTTCLKLKIFSASGQKWPKQFWCTWCQWLLCFECQLRMHLKSQPFLHSLSMWFRKVRTFLSHQRCIIQVRVLTPVRVRSTNWRSKTLRKRCHFCWTCADIFLCHCYLNNIVWQLFECNLHHIKFPMLSRDDLRMGEGSTQTPHHFMGEAWGLQGWPHSSPPLRSIPYTQF